MRANPLPFILRSAAYSWRLAVRQPVSTSVTLFTIALGIGATAALFSVVQAWILRPPPFADPDRLVVIWELIPSAGITENTPAPASVAAWRERASSFEAIGSWTLTSANLTGAGEPQRLRAVQATAEVLPVLGVRPFAGRAFVAADAQPGAAPVALVAHDFWRTSLAGDAAVVGRRIVLDGKTVEVIGVLPEALPMLGYPFDIWLPLSVNASDENRMLWVYARLKPGVTVEGASREVSTIGETRPGSGMPARAVALQTQLTGRIGGDVMLLFAASALVLLIACANVASLTLARVTSRRDEFIVRSALGAGRARIAAQVLIESLTVSLAGGALGLVAATWLVQSIVVMAPQSAGRFAVSSTEPRVFLFALAASALSGALFGMFPAWRAASADIGQGLRASARTVVAGRRFLGTLVAGEIALALALLVGSALILRSYANLAATELGFRADKLVFADITRPAGERQAARIGYYTELESRLRASAGVEGVAMTQAMPLRSVGSMAGGFLVEGQPPDQSILSFWRVVNDDYFRTLEIPMLRGRTFEPGDRDGSQAVAIVSQSFARRAWGSGEAIGRRIGWGTLDSPLTVVGVAADVRHSPSQEARPHVYLSYRQAGSRPPTQIAIRTNGTPAAAIDLLRRTVSSIDRTQPIAAIATGEELLSRSMRRQRFQATLMTLFAVAAALLAIVGIYGVLSFAATQARREMGVRLALGASPSQIRGAILRRGLVLSGIGAAAGVALSAAGARVIESYLFKISARDLPTYIAAVVLLMTVTLLVCLIPANRAARLDPLAALRE